MRIKSILLVIFLISNITSSNMQAQDNKPAVIAQNLSVLYGVRSDAIQAILCIYEKEGLGVSERKSRTERLLKQYSLVPEKINGSAALSNDTKTQLGVNTAVAEALDWDIFARKNYLSTVGDNSAAVVTKGDVNIWYGIPPAAVRALADVLEQAKTSIADLDERLKAHVKKYEDLKTDLEAYGLEDPLIKKSLQLLSEGKFTEVSELLDSTLTLEDKRMANLHFLDGGVKKLLLKFDIAAFHYLKAIILEPENPRYLLFYANNEHTRAHYAEAIIYYQKILTLTIDTITFRDKPEQMGVLFNNIGSAWSAKGEYDRAIVYFQKALEIDSITFGSKHPRVAIGYENLGSAWQAKGEYDLSLAFYLKALDINTIELGNEHSNVAHNFNNIGNVLREKGEYDRAITFYHKALDIDSILLGNLHPFVAVGYNSLGLAWSAKGKYDQAIIFYQKALSIDTVAFGNRHPTVATVYNNLGEAWRAKGESDKAIVFYQKALGIDSIILGNKHPNVSRDFNNLGLAWNAKGKHDHAIFFYHKALAIDTVLLGNKHTNIATVFNNLGGAWRGKGEYDRSIIYYLKALGIDSVVLGNIHPNVATEFNNLGLTWKAKGDYDQSINFYKKALHIDSLIFGNKNPKVAIRYKNIGEAYAAKGEYDLAIALYQKAIGIDSVEFSNKHPSVAADFNNLGLTWYSKREYDKAIECFRKCQIILALYFDSTHPYQTLTARSYSLAANARGMEFFREKKYVDALSYFKNALENAEVAKDQFLSVSCLNNIGSSNKFLGNYTEGLSTIEKGIEIAEKLRKEFAEKEKDFTYEFRSDSKYPVWREEQLQTAILIRMRYHQIGCLIGVGRSKEAEDLAAKVLEEAYAIKDQRTIDDLKKDGWVKE